MIGCLKEWDDGIYIKVLYHELKVAVIIGERLLFIEQCVLEVEGGDHLSQSLLLDN